MYGGYSDDLTGMLGKQLDKGDKGMNFKRSSFETEDKLLVELTRHVTQC